MLLKSVESGTGFVSLQGDVLTRVLYLTDEDKFESFYMTESFKEEIEVDGAEKKTSLRHIFQSRKKMCQAKSKMMTMVRNLQ